MGINKDAQVFRDQETLSRAGLSGLAKLGAKLKIQQDGQLKEIDSNQAFKALADGASITVTGADGRSMQVRNLGELYSASMEFGGQRDAYGNMSPNWPVIGMAEEMDKAAADKKNLDWAPPFGFGGFKHIGEKKEVWDHEFKVRAALSQLTGSGTSLQLEQDGQLKDVDVNKAYETLLHGGKLTATGAGGKKIEISEVGDLYSATNELGGGGGFGAPSGAGALPGGVLPAGWNPAAGIPGGLGGPALAPPVLGAPNQGAQVAPGTPLPFSPRAPQDVPGGYFPG
jgi:hypothetical protein